jgi:hypothetical protein
MSLNKHKQPAFRSEMYQIYIQSREDQEFILLNMGYLLKLNS